MQALPVGSGNLEIIISPGKISVQFSFFKVFSDIHFSLPILFMNFETPIFPVCINRIPESD